MNERRLLGTTTDTGLDDHMQTLIPLSGRELWTTTHGAGTDEDTTIAIDRGSDVARCSVRTMVRPGTRVGPRGHVHGMVTDPVTIASLAAGCLLLGTLPTDSRKRDGVAVIEEVEARSLALAQDRDGWTVSILPVDGIDYALFSRTIPEGTIAHADLGWAVIAMWSTGSVYDGPLQRADVNPDDHLPDR